MYYGNYLNYVLDHNDLIYVDTSTLMNADSMQLFIQRAEDEFLARNKRMIVTQWVQKELNKHIRSDNENKRDQARAALLLLAKYDSLFILEDDNAILDSATFADSDLLSRLVLNKATATQLLITYDRSLALDAYNLNNQGSNKGGKVMVCHINRAGYIKKCDCVGSPNHESDDVPIEPEVIVREKIVYVNRPVEKEIVSNTKAWKTPVAIATGFISGIAFEKFALPFIKRTIASI